MRRTDTGFLLLLALLAAVLFLPFFAARELDGEEGRRAVPAREMLDSGNAVLPTIWGEPYLSKPPLFYWLVAAASLPDGNVDEAGTRLPSVLATILTALAVAWTGGRLGGRFTGRAAGLLFVCTLIVFEKGALGELEAVFGLAVYAGLAGLWLGRHGSWSWIVVSGLFLGAALLTKGPPALVFYVAGLIGIARAGHGTSELRSPRVWIPVAIGAGLATLWLVPLLQQTAADGLLDVWGREIARTHGLDWAGYLWERGDYAATVLLGLFPGSAVLLAVLGTSTWTRVREEPFVRFALTTIVLGLAFFLLSPGTRTRYVYPLVPLLCLVCARVLHVSRERGEAARGRLRIPGYLTVLLGLLVAAAAAYLLFAPIGEIDGLGPWGWVLVAAIAVTAVVALRRWGNRRVPAPLLPCLAILCLLRMLEITVVVPRLAEASPKQDAARRLERVVPPGQVLHVGVWDHFNTLAYVRRTLRYTRNAGAEAPGSFVLLDREAVQRVTHQSAYRVQTVLETTVGDGDEVSVVRNVGTGR